MRRRTADFWRTEIAVKLAASRVAFCLTGIFVLSVMYFPGPGGDWYQEARLDTTLALAYHGTLAIDAYQQNTQDKTFYRGHYYGITAPGQSLAGAPLAASYRLFTPSAAHQKPGAGALSQSGRRTSYQYFVMKYLVTLITVTLPGALLLLLFFWFLGYLTDSLWNRALLTLALGLATDVFPYSQVLYAHVPAGLLLFTAFVLAYLLGAHRARGPVSAWLLARPPFAMALVGAGLGASVCFEYQTAVVAVIIAGYVASRVPKRLLPYLAVGSLPGVLTVLACDEIIYGNPLVTGYSHYSVLWHGAFRNDAAGFSWPPKPSALWGMSLSPYRGVFFLSPFLLLAIPGICLWKQRSLPRWPLIGIPVVYVLLMAMSPFWYGGVAVGPRYLTPVVPFLALPILPVLDRAQSRILRWGVYALMALSAFNVWAQTVGGTGYPFTAEANPLLHYSLPAILHGTVRANLGSVVTAPFGAPYSPLSLLPLAVLLAAWTVFVFRGAIRRGAARADGPHGAGTPAA